MRTVSIRPAAAAIGGVCEHRRPDLPSGSRLGCANVAHFLALPLVAEGNPHFRHAKMPVGVGARGPQSSMAGRQRGFMSGYRNSSNRLRQAMLAWGAAFAVALLSSGVALAQDVQPPPAEPPPAAAPNLLDMLGRWLDDSKAKIDSQIKSTTDAMQGAAKDAKDAAEKAGQASGAAIGWPGSKRAHGRVRCAVAPNGAPDCGEAANALCRSKGFGPGKSLEVNTADKCPSWVWLSAQRPPEGTCKTETFVLQATCQ
jgi:hypothetical protein